VFPVLTGLCYVLFEGFWVSVSRIPAQPPGSMDITLSPLLHSPLLFLYQHFSPSLRASDISPRHPSSPPPPARTPSIKLLPRVMSCELWSDPVRRSPVLQYRRSESTAGSVPIHICGLNSVDHCHLRA